MSGSGGFAGFAKKRTILVPGEGRFETPLLVPSFSSKGFKNLDHIVTVTKAFLDAELLISAYDISHGHLLQSVDFASLLFLDSGGYEASKDQDLAEHFDALDTEHKPKEWTEDLFESVLSNFNPIIPVVYISYDHPNRRISIEDQVDAALKFGGAQRQIARELLLKPTTNSRAFLDIDEIVAHVKKYAPFAVIGVTEKEIGSSLLDRMANIGRLRMALTSAGLETPIHVFGSLDTLSTLLYFVMGADIFDGLTWLRYAYDGGSTVYRQELGATRFPSDTTALNVTEKGWYENHQYLRSMALRMKRFVIRKDFDALEYNVEHVRRLVDDAWGKIGAM